MTIKKASLYISSLYLAMFLHSRVIGLVKPFLEPITQMGLYMIDKGIFAVGLLIIVYTLNLQRQCGLVFKANWRTLPLYWPLVVIAGLILASGINTDTSASMLAIICLTTLAVGIGEELMFRGLAFHWLRDLSVRKQILISALSFGGLHLLGLMSEIPAPIIFAMAFYAAGLGVIWGYARSRDYSIMIPIVVHWIFDFIVIGSKGGLMEMGSGASIDQVVISMLAVGAISWAWGGFLLWKAGRKDSFDSLPSNTSVA